MRNWFVLFATTFTITTLTIAIHSTFLPQLPEFNNQYIVLLAISSALCTFYIFWTNRLQIQHVVLKIFMDIIGLSLIVYVIGILIQFVPSKGLYYITVLSLVAVIYFIITLIYMFILQKETKQMNAKISEWRKKNVENKTLE